MVIDFNYKKGFTHSGKFHADDVFSTALLKLIDPEIEIFRGNEVPEDFQGIVYDIGLGKYDHHQADRELREDGTPYAAFGLLWKAFGELLIEKEGVKMLDNCFVRLIDISDNTPSKNLLSSAISWFNMMPSDQDYEEKEDSQFNKAVDLAKTILEESICHIKDEIRNKNEVDEKVKETQGDILVLEKYMTWKESVKGTDIAFVVYPSQRGGYCVSAVSEDDSFGRLKYRFSENLGGLNSCELEKQTGIKGFLFCHAGGFLCAADSLKAAYRIIDFTKTEYKKCS